MEANSPGEPGKQDAPVTDELTGRNKSGGLANPPKPKRRSVTPKATKRNKRQTGTGKAPKRNTTPEQFYVYQQRCSQFPNSVLHRFEVHTKRNGDMWLVQGNLVDMWLYPYLYDVADVPKRPEPSVDEPWPTTPFVKFDELKWHPQRQRKKREFREVLSHKPRGKDRCWPGKSAYQTNDIRWDITGDYNYMSEEQARWYVEYVNPEPEWRKGRTSNAGEGRRPFRWVRRRAPRNIHLQVLGLTQDDPQQIKRAYHHLSVQHHPDHGGDAAEFKKINDAYKALVG